MKRNLIIFAVLAGFALAAYVAGRLHQQTVDGVPPIPERTVPVEVVGKIPPAPYIPLSPDRPPPLIVERVQLVTAPAPPPEIHRLVDVVTADPATLEAQVEIDAAKFVGQDRGTVREGWLGEAVCQIRNAQSDWVEVARSGFDLSTSSAVSVVPPAVPPTLKRRLDVRLGVGSAPHAALGFTWYGRGKRWGWGAEVHYDPDPAVSFTSDQFSRADRYRATAYISRRFGRIE